MWCLEQILLVQESYIDAFNTLKSGEYYKAWCALEGVEIALLHLLRHFPVDGNNFFLRLIQTHVERYQRLYSYQVFVSPEYLCYEKVCDICGQPVSIRSPCGHRAGEIYNGRLCTRTITKTRLLTACIVTEPTQKYSVVFPVGDDGTECDPYDYALVRYVVERLRSPFHRWDYAWTYTYRPHSNYRAVGRNELCPCDSGMEYERCCLSAPGVRRPHCLVRFDVPPPAELPAIRVID
jgi:hypothetical protein